MNIISKTLLISCFGLFLLTGCGNEERKTFFDNGQVKTIGSYDGDGLRQGSFKQFNEKGIVLKQGDFVDNKLKKGFYLDKEEIQLTKSLKYSFDIKISIDNFNETKREYINKEKFINELSELLKKSPFAILKLPNEFKIEELKIISVATNPMVVLDLDNPSKELRKLAINNKPDIYFNLKDTNIEELKLMLTKNPKLFSRLKNPSKEIIDFVFKQDVNMLEFIKTPLKEEKYIKALNTNPSLIKFIRKPSLKLQKIVIEKDGSLIRLIKEPSENIINIALNQNINNIVYIKNPSNNIQLRLIKENPELFENRIQNKSEQAILEYLKINPSFIRTITNQTKEQQEIAFEASPNVFPYLKKPNYDLVIKALDFNKQYKRYISFPTNYKKLDNKLLSIDGSLILKIQFPRDNEQINIAFDNDPYSVMRHRAGIFKWVSSDNFKNVVKKTPKICSSISKEDNINRNICLEVDYNYIKYLKNNNNTYICSNYFNKVFENGTPNDKTLFKRNKPCMGWNILEYNGIPNQLTKYIKKDPKLILLFENPTDLLKIKAIEFDKSLIKEYGKKNWINENIFSYVVKKYGHEYGDILSHYNGPKAQKIKKELKEKEEKLRIQKELELKKLEEEKKKKKVTKEETIILIQQFGSFENKETIKK